jgi:hypothetical protein
MAEMKNNSATDYRAHFNAVLTNYWDALRLDGQGSAAHRRAARGVDVLMEEYAKAADLLDRVRGHCREQVERAFMTGEDYRALAESFATIYPPLATDMRDFCATLEVCV